MTIVATHRGPISGKTHLHLLRESAAVRSARAASQLKDRSGEPTAESADRSSDRPYRVRRLAEKE